MVYRLLRKWTDMGAVISPKAWDDNSQAKLQYLEGLVGKLAREKIEGLESEVKALTSERDILKGRLSNYEAVVKAVKAEADAKIKAANKSHADGSSRQRGVWEAQIRELNAQINKLAADKLAANKEVNTLRSEVSRLEGDLKTQVVKVEMLESIKNDTSQILELVRDLASKGATASEIVEAVENVSIRDKILVLIRLEGQGLKGPELLDQLRPYGVKAQSRISELRKNPLYAELGGKAYRGKGGDKHVEA